MERETRNTDEGVIELGAVSTLTEGVDGVALDTAGQRYQAGISDD
jgi:hypothetical protein